MDRRRPGNKTTPLEKGELQQALGYDTKAYKKPAAALRTKKPAAALGKAKKKGYFGKGGWPKETLGENQKNYSQEVKP